MDADIKGAFDNIDHDFLLKAIGETPGRELIRQRLKAGVMEDGGYHATEMGTPQGGVISPLLLNIALHGMEAALTKYMPLAGPTTCPENAGAWEKSQGAEPDSPPMAGTAYIVMLWTVQPASTWNFPVPDTCPAPGDTGCPESQVMSKAARPSRGNRPARAMETTAALIHFMVHSLGRLSCRGEAAPVQNVQKLWRVGNDGFPPESEARPPDEILPFTLSRRTPT